MTPQQCCVAQKMSVSLYGAGYMKYRKSTVLLLWAAGHTTMSETVVHLRSWLRGSHAGRWPVVWRPVVLPGFFASCYFFRELATRRTTTHCTSLEHFNYSFLHHQMLA